eukprot:9360264-Pyramimonas_sp.AAC.1
MNESAVDPQAGGRESSSLSGVCPFSSPLPPPPCPPVGRASSQPFLPSDKFSIASWNSAGLFGSVFGKHWKQLSRYRHFKTLLGRPDTVLIQGSHGSEADSQYLRGEQPACSFWGSFCDDHAAGGVVVAVRKALARRFQTIEPLHIQEGRILMLSAQGGEGGLQVVNLHLVPMLSLASKKQTLRAVARRILPRSVSTCWFG